MAYKTIVAILQGEDDAARVLDVAVAFARRWDGHLIGVHAEPLPMPIASPMGFPDATIIGAGEDMSRERAEAVERVFTARLKGETISAEWRSMLSFSGDSALSALDSARCGDVVIAGQSGRDGGAAGVPDIDTLIQSGGRPVLIVPAEGEVSTAARRIVVAWNGSRESARAVFDALHFIVAADETTILTVDPVESPGDSGPLAGAEIAAALARHGAAVSVETMRSGDLSVGEAIIGVVRDKQADLLVLGAFSHSRLREMIFGGTTRTIADTPPCLTLMSR